MRICVTVKDTGDRTNDLRVATRVRQDLFARAPIETVPDSPLHGIHRDENGRSYFEFSTESLDEVHRVLKEHGHAAHVELAEEHEGWGEPCQNCGNIAGAVLPSVCPNCGFRDIAPCPVCHSEVPRQQYVRIESALFSCPSCHSRVRLRFNEPMFLADGSYNQPLVVVEAAEVRAT